MKILAKDEILEKYAVHFSWEDGDIESGPLVHTGVDIIDAYSEEDACNIWKKEYGYQFDKSPNCWAELATQEQIDEYEYAPYEVMKE